MGLSPDRPPRDGRHWRPSALHVYVWAVVALGVGVVVLVLRGADLAHVVQHAPRPVWLLAIALLLGELGPIPVARGDDETSEITMSTTFAIALVSSGSLGLLLMVHTAAVLFDDIRTRRSPIKVAFNFGQYAISLAAARGVFAIVGGHPLLAGYTPLRSFDLLASLLAGMTFLLINNGMVAVVVALASGQPVVATLRDDIAFKMEASSVLVGLGPVAAVLADTSGWLLPLLALPVLAVRRSAVLAAQRHRQAMRDALTGLGNRELFFTRTERSLARCARGEEPLAVLMIDLDHFKDINDTLGHQVGDQLIQQIAVRIQAATPPGGCVARLGGDEFAVLLDDTDGPRAEMVAQRMLDDVVRPLQIAGTRLAVQASIGVALAEPDIDVSTLMQRADIALYEAKRERARWCVYDHEVSARSPERLVLLADLREAVQMGALTVAFQPQVGLSDGRVTGAEALARWNHPVQGAIGPEEFIALAENAGLISQVTDLVLEGALDALNEWNAAGLASHVSVNLSPRQLSDLSLPERIAASLLRHAIDPHQLTVEVTESSIMGDPRRAGQILRELRAFGVRVAIDDFGTGYSSLAYLKSLDLDEIKVDRSFVTTMCSDANDVVLVRSIIELGHNLGLSVVAEGVEELEQVERLRELGCDVVQGFHVGRPMDREMMTMWLRHDALLRHAADAAAAGVAQAAEAAAVAELPRARAHLTPVPSIAQG